MVCGEGGRWRGGAKVRGFFLVAFFVGFLYHYSHAQVESCGHGEGYILKYLAETTLKERTTAKRMG